MSIPANYDSHLLDRRCVAAYFQGRLEDLLREVHLSGHTEITLEDLHAKGELYHEAWRIGDDSKTTCYLCRQAVTPGTLCACFNLVVAKRHYNVMEPKLLQRLHPSEIVETYVCRACGDIAHVHARHAINSHRRHGRYQVRTMCPTCHRQSKAAGKDTHQLQQLVAEATATISTGEA